MEIAKFTYKNRNLDQVNEILDLAKVDRCELNPCIQSLQFSENLCNDLKLMELNNSVLEELQLGNRVVIRGRKDDQAVLCTGSNTYEIKEAETSNSLLIFPTLKIPENDGDSEQTLLPQQVTSIVRSYYELRPCKPRNKRLTELLSENMYSGRECEGDENHAGNKYTFQQLIDIVQASEGEMRAELSKIKACQINGEWRLLDFDFLTQVLNHIISLCEENDWLDSGIDLETCFKELDELYPRDVVHHVITIYSESPSTDNTTNVVRLSDDKICQFFAELLLRHADKFNLSEFLSVWQQSVPQSMKTHLRQLKGLALIDFNSHPNVVWYYPIDDLPENVEQRFRALFKAKEKWTLDEISPYIKDATSEKADIGALLTKYCRASMMSGVKVYNSRNPVT